MDTYKKINLSLLALAALFSFLVWFWWKYKCVDSVCSQTQIDGFLEPSLFGSFAFTILLATLVVYPSHFFKKWQLYIGIPGLIIMTILVRAIDPIESHFLNPSRGNMAWLVGIFIFLVTAVYLIIWHIYRFKKHRLHASSLLTLFALIPPAALFYVVLQLF